MQHSFSSVLSSNISRALRTPQQMLFLAIIFFSSFLYSHSVPSVRSQKQYRINQPNWGSEEWAKLFLTSLRRDSHLQHDPCISQDRIATCSSAPSITGQSCAFVAQSVFAQTIRSYLCAVRFYQIAHNYSDPLLPTMAKLSYVQKGTQKLLSNRYHPRRLPVTSDILSEIHKCWSKGPVKIGMLYSIPG